MAGSTSIGVSSRTRSAAAWGSQILSGGADAGTVNTTWSARSTRGGSIRGQSLSPRMPASATRGRGGAKLASTLASAPTPALLWATSKTKRRSSIRWIWPRPGQVTEATPSCTASRDGGRASSSNARTATAALTA